jgi:hypothetical protein
MADINKEKKQIIKKYEVSLGPKVIDGSIDGVSDRITTKINSVLANINYDPKICSVKLAGRSSGGYYYYRPNRYYIVVTRTETDDEFAVRIKTEKEKHQRELAKERARREANRKRDTLLRIKRTKDETSRKLREESEERQLLKLLMKKYDVKC